jgi:hypothetical protein
MSHITMEPKDSFSAFSASIDGDRRSLQLDAIQDKGDTPMNKPITVIFLNLSIEDDELSEA